MIVNHVIKLWSPPSAHTHTHYVRWPHNINNRQIPPFIKSSRKKVSNSLKHLSRFPNRNRCCRERDLCRTLINTTWTNRGDWRRHSFKTMPQRFVYGTTSVWLHHRGMHMELESSEQIEISWNSPPAERVCCVRDWFEHHALQIICNFEFEFTF